MTLIRKKTTHRYLFLFRSSSRSWRALFLEN